MGLQLSRKHPAAAQANDNSPQQENTELGLAHVNGLYDFIQRGDKDEHGYGNAGVAASENARKVRMGSEITLSRSVIVLLVVGMVLISTVISIISGVVVYHKTNGKITPMDLEEKQNNSNMADIDRRLDTLDKILQQQQNTPNIADIDRRLDTLDEMIQEIQDTPNMADIDRRLDTLDGRMNAVQDTVEAVQAKQNTSAPKIAFTIHTPTGLLLPGSHTPMFDVILLNEGGAYHNSTGQFTCPVQGLYLFTVTLRSVSRRSIYLYCYIDLNHDEITKAYSHDGSYDSASVTTFVHLSVGDVVELSCYRWQEIDKGPETLFSGALIRAD